LRGRVDEEKKAPPAVDWEAVRIDYEAKVLPVRQVAEQHGVAQWAMLHKAKAEGWKPRSVSRSVDRAGIIARMFRLLERQIIQLERDMDKTGEKEVAVLGKLASTLEKLIEIDRAERPQPPTRHKDMQELRDKLALRIAQLKGV
jgi:hypothetical protein